MVIVFGYSAHSVAEVAYTIDLETLYNDNTYLLQTDEVDSFVGIVRPGIMFEAASGGSKYRLEAEAESGTYTQSVNGDDDYTDYQVSGKAQMEFTVRNRLQLDLTHEKGHDDRGTARQDGSPKSVLSLSDTPDQWRDNVMDMMYTYGAEASRARVSVGGSVRSVEYTNNRIDALGLGGTATLDHDDVEVRAIGYLKVLPRTSVLLEVRSKDIEYDETVINRDSQDDRYFLGLEWDSTAKTTGSIRFGYQQKDPDDPTLDEYHATAWEMKMVWKPKRYSAVTLEAFRGAEDSLNSASSVDTAFLVVNWEHDWTARFSTELYGLTKSDDYDNALREDDIEGFGFSAAYELTQWLTVKGGYEYSDRDTTEVGLDYESNKVLLGLDIELR